MKRLAVFASGTGSNFQALVGAAASNDLQAEIALLVCDNLNAPVLEKAKQVGVPVFAFNPKEFDSKAEFEASILEQLQFYNIDLIVLAGYMRLVGTTLLEAYPNKIINIHPSLLPSFPGKDAIGQAIRSGVKITGVTIHYVDQGMDTGPIIAQKAIAIEKDDTLSDVEAKIHQVEHSFYPEIIGKLVNRRFESETSVN